MIRFAAHDTYLAGCAQNFRSGRDRRSANRTATHVLTCIAASSREGTTQSQGFFQPQPVKCQPFRGSKHIEQQMWEMCRTHTVERIKVVLNNGD